VKVTAHETATTTTYRLKDNTMNTNINIHQDSWFDPFSTRGPRPEAAQGNAASSVASGFCPAASLIDPGEDPNDDPDLQARG
jgi:hypothetical protein